MTASAYQPRFDPFWYPLLAGTMPDTPDAGPPTHAAGSTTVATTVVSPESATRDMIAAIARGDTSAFAAFYEQWFDRGVDLVHKLTRRDESFCLDVVQDAMVRAIKSLTPRLGISSRIDLDRWMTRVLHTTALDHLRKESRRRVRELRSATGVRRVRAGTSSVAMVSSAIPSMTNMADPSTLPTVTSELDERIAWVRQRLNEIDALDRQLVVSQYGRGQTVAAAAASVDLTPGAATGRLTRLLNRLRAAAKEMFHDES